MARKDESPPSGTRSTLSDVNDERFFEQIGGTMLHIEDARARAERAVN